MKATVSLLCGALLACASAASAQSGGIDGILAPVPDAAPTVAPRAAAPARASKMRLGEAEVFERVARKLTERLALEDGELTISPVAAWTPIDVPAGTWDITLTEAPDLKGLTSNFFIRFRLDAGDRQIGEWQVPVRAEYFRDGLGGQPPLAARRDANSARPRQTPPQHSRRAPDAHRGKNPVDGFEVAQSVAAGQPLTDRDLAPRTLVRRGQVVNVIAADGPFSVSMKALATQDGASGAMIKVRNLTSQRDITAQVVGEGKVQVRF